MFIQTHWSIGESMVRNLTETFPFAMDKLAFQYGCIAPDFMKGVPDHTKESSIHYTAALICELQQVDLLHAKRDGNRDCFVKMGIISHYIADYFCRPHNDDPRYKQLFPHILYENHLHFECSSAVLLQMSRTGLEDYYRSLYPNKRSPLDYLNERHAAYLAQPPGMEKDIQYAVQTSMTVITAIIDRQLLAARGIAA